MITHTELRKRYTEFWQSRGHVEVPGIPLVPQNDPTTLFTGSGMQQLVPNLLGEPHPQGSRLFNIQRCIRAQDIDEVGDNRHDTFFEMMGNWSLGDYFKQEQLPWVFDLYTNIKYGFGLNPNRIYVTVFGGGDGVECDEESVEIWKSLFNKQGIQTDVGTADTFHEGQHITLYDAKKNWWSRSGPPSEMPIGEVGGPDSELFFDFGESLKLHENAKIKDHHCNVNCDCGRFLEIGNSVFIQFIKQSDGTLKELPKKNVDFGGGLERVLATIQNDPDVFNTDVFAPIIEALSDNYNGHDEQTKKQIRIIADHMRTAVNLAADGIHPGPKEQSYVMRTLIRRAYLAAMRLGIPSQKLIDSCAASINIFRDVYEPIREKYINGVIEEEIRVYENTIENGKKEFKKILKAQAGTVMINGQQVFNIYQSTGLPPEVILLVGESEGAIVNLSGFEEAKKVHSDSSRAGSEQKFKGGLADQSEQVVKYHTATHLLHQALTDVLGPLIRQEGSNITGERLRFDFRCDHKPTPDEIVSISTILNGKIEQALPVNSMILPKSDAEKVGAKSFFKEKYPNDVKIYFVGNSLEDAYSKEYCGGPHVANTREIGRIDIFKVEKIGKDLFRIYGK